MKLINYKLFSLITPTTLLYAICVKNYMDFIVHLSYTRQKYAMSSMNSVPLWWKKTLVYFCH